MKFIEKYQTLKLKFKYTLYFSFKMFIQNILNYIKLNQQLLKIEYNYDVKMNEFEIEKNIYELKY